MTHDEIERLEALEKAATPPPWNYNEREGEIELAPMEYIGSFCNPKDDRLAIALRNAAPALIASAKALAEAQARVKQLEAGLKRAAEMADALPELNMSNFDHDQVCELNSGAVELCLFLRSLSPILPPYEP